jgi:hypothetical protein
MLEKWSKDKTLHSLSHVKYGRTISGIGHEVERTNISKDESEHLKSQWANHRCKINDKSNVLVFFVVL